MTTHLFARFVHAIWLGSGLFLVAVAAPAAFRVAPSSTVAAEFVGAMLMRWHYIALAAPLLLLLLDWRRGRVYVLLIVFVAIILASGQVAADLRIRSIRMSSPIPISELSREDPLRRQFGRLHGISALLLIMQVVAAGAALAIDRESYPAPRGGQPPSAVRTGEAPVLQSSIDKQPQISDRPLTSPPESP